MRPLILALALIAVPAGAVQRVATSGDSSLTLYDAPCRSLSVLAALKPEWRESFQRAELVMGGAPVAGCWIEMEEGPIFIMLEDGREAVLPASAFKDRPGA